MSEVIGYIPYFLIIWVLSSLVWVVGDEDRKERRSFKKYVSLGFITNIAIHVAIIFYKCYFI